MPSVTGSPFDDEPVLRSASVKSSFSVPSVPNHRRLPIDSLPSIKDLSLSFLFFLRLFVRSVSFYTPPNFFSASSFLLSLSLRREEKCPEIFCLPSFTHSRRFSTLDTARFRRRQYSACAIVFLESVIKPVVYG